MLKVTLYYFEQIQCPRKIDRFLNFQTQVWCLRLYETRPDVTPRRHKSKIPWIWGETTIVNDSKRRDSSGREVGLLPTCLHRQDDGVFFYTSSVCVDQVRGSIGLDLFHTEWSQCVSYFQCRFCSWIQMVYRSVTNRGDEILTKRYSELCVRGDLLEVLWTTP